MTENRKDPQSQMTEKEKPINEANAFQSQRFIEKKSKDQESMKKEDDELLIQDLQIESDGSDIALGLEVPFHSSQKENQVSSIFYHSSH